MSMCAERRVRFPVFVVKATHVVFWLDGEACHLRVMIIYIVLLLLRGVSTAGASSVSIQVAKQLKHLFCECWS